MGTTVPDVAYYSQVSTLFQALTRYIAWSPVNLHVNPLIRTSTPQHAPGRGRPRTSHRAHVRGVRPACRSSGPRAGHRANVRLQGPACSSSGQRAPSRTRVQVIGPTCAFKGPRAGHRAHVQDVRPTCRSSGPRAAHRANVRLQGPACRSSGQRAPSRTRVRMGRPMRGHVDPGALTAMLPDGNCGTVVAGPGN